MSIFEVLAGQEVLNLLLVSIMSSKEAKRTFLTPESLDFLKSSQMFFIGKVIYHVHWQLLTFLANQELILISILSIQVLQ